MESKSLDAQHQRQVFFVVCGAGLCVLVGFSILSYIETNVPAMWTHIVMALVIVGGPIALLLGVENQRVYRLTLWGIAIGLWGLVGITTSLLYYALVMPLLMFFFLGRREGRVGAGIFLLGMMTMLLLAPNLVGSQVYQIGNALKFLVGYLFITTFGWNYEKSREQSYALLAAKNEHLRREKEQLKDALGQVRETESQLKQTVTRLQDQTRLMETVFNSMSEGIVVVDATGRQLLYNPSAERISGIGKVPSEPSEWAEIYGIFYPDKETYVPVDKNPLVCAMRGESIDDFEAFVRNEKQLEGVHVNGTGRPIRSDETGEVKAAVFIFRDVTKYKKIEAQLEQTISELRGQTQLMQTVFKSVSDGVVVTGKDGEFLFVNPTAEHIVGMGATDVPSDHWAETYGTFYPDRKTPFPSDELPLVRAMRGETLDDVELFIRNQERPKGVSISVSARPLQHDSGMIEGGVIVLRDITRLKETEAELRQTVLKLQDQTRLMETIFRSISDGVAAADENGNFTIFNPSAERMVGMGITDTGPEYWTDRYGIFFPDRETPVPMEELSLVRAIRGEASDEVEMFVRNPKVPEGVYISVSGRPLHDDSGMTKGGVIVFRDVTERVRAEEALSQAFAQGRLEIVDTILHNIGNAINSVATGVGTIYGQLARNELVHRLSALAEAIEAHRDDWIPYLKTDPQGQKVMPFILALAKDFATQNARLTQTVERVENRVGHIVDIIRTQRSLDSGAMVRKDINLQKAITDAVKLLQDSITKRGIEIEIDGENAPQEIRTLESKFHQMLVNLIKNAIEAIDELEKLDGLEVKPSIQIRSYVQGGFLVLDVIDNGIGIEEKRSKIIFAAGYTTKEGGSGLGLHSIANFIIGSGGKIYPLSAGTGKGTTMRVKLRLASVALKSEAAGEGGTLP